MKVKGLTDKAEIVQLTHKGFNFRFAHHCPSIPIHKENFNRINMPIENIVEIEFDDSSEVSALIKMLEEFEYSCMEYGGSWSRELYKK